MSRVSLLLIVFLMLSTFISAIAVVYSQHKNRQLFVMMQSQLKQQDQLNIHFGRLQLEQSTWASYGRVEDNAINRLDMQPPALNDLQFIVLKESK